MREELAAPASGNSEPVLLRLQGEYDIARSAELDRLLAQAYDASVAVLDVRDVAYIDSTAIACLVRLRKRMAASGRASVRLVMPQRNVRRVLELTQLDQVFEIHESVEEALEP